jgi:hypothetical protein
LMAISDARDSRRSSPCKQDVERASTYTRQTFLQR